jgi:hypothetical protein
MWATTFEVEGNGGFPYDMLRYDTCFPLDTLSAQTMEVSSEVRYSGELRTIKLRCIHRYKTWVPTVARWNSFGWGLKSIEPAVKW